MAIIQTQRPLVDEYISQGRKVQPIQEVNIGDSVNPFRPEIVKLICALQLTGRFRNTNIAQQEVTRRNNKVIDPYEVSLYDNSCQAGCQTTVTKKCKNTKWGAKHFGKVSKMHEVSDESPLLNTYKDTAGGQNCGPFSFTFNAHKEEITKGHKTEHLNEPNIDSAAYRNDYNSYLVARYESEYGDVNLLSSKNSESSKIHNEEEEAQYAENDMYVLKKSSSDHLCMYSKNQIENQAVVSGSNHNTNQKLETYKSKNNTIHCDEQTSSQAVDNVSQHYQPETCGKGEEKPVGANLFPTYSVICAESSSEHLAQISHKKAREHNHKLKDNSIHCDEQTCGQAVDYVSQLYQPETCGNVEEKSLGANFFPTYSVICAESSSEHLAQLSHKEAREYNHSRKQVKPVTGEEKESTNEVTDSESVCELYRMKEKSYCYNTMDSASNNKIHITNDQRTNVTGDNVKKCSLSSENTAEYLFQNFIQPEDENNIQLLLEQNLSSGNNSSHYKSIQEINTVPDWTLEEIQENQSKPQIQENIVDINRETETSVLEYNSRITKQSYDSLNEEKENIPAIERKVVSQEFIQDDGIQQHLNNTTSSTNTATYERQNGNLSNPFFKKKVYWSSVGLIIEDINDSNILPVAGHSDISLSEPQDSKTDKMSSTVHDDGNARDQNIHIGSINCSRLDMTNGTEDTSFITEPGVNGSTDMLENDKSQSGKLFPEDVSDKSKKTKKPQQKGSFLKSLQRFFGFSRKQ